jgi:hypothetical protein
VSVTVAVLVETLVALGVDVGVIVIVGVLVPVPVAVAVPVLVDVRVAVLVAVVVRVGTGVPSTKSHAVKLPVPQVAPGASPAPLHPEKVRHMFVHAVISRVLKHWTAPAGHGIWGEPPSHSQQFAPAPIGVVSVVTNTANPAMRRSVIMLPDNLRVAIR